MFTLHLLRFSQPWFFFFAVGRLSWFWFWEVLADRADDPWQPASPWETPDKPTKKGPSKIAAWFLIRFWDLNRRRKRQHLTKFNRCFNLLRIRLLCCRWVLESSSADPICLSGLTLTSHVVHRGPCNWARNGAHKGALNWREEHVRLVFKKTPGELRLD